MEKRKTLLKGLAVRRKAAGLTQEQLGQIVGLDQNAVSRYESGLHLPRKDVLIRLAIVLNCEVKDLF